MRSLILMVLVVLAMPARADSVHGFCERDGKRITFSDGIAFVDARDADGVVTTTIYLTAKPLDRKALLAANARLRRVKIPSAVRAGMKLRSSARQQRTVGSRYSM